MALSEHAALQLVGDVPAFIDKLSKDSAKELIKREADGTYVIRYSAKSSALVLTISHNGRVRHFPITRSGNNFTLDGQTKKATITELLRALSKKGFKDASGHKVIIGRPCQAAADAHLEEQVGGLYVCFYCPSHCWL
jgi:hypothetical protein